MIVNIKHRQQLLAILLFSYPWQTLMAEQNIHIIDDRTTDGIQTQTGSEWRLLTDGVMGGVSEGQLSPATIEDHPCLRMRGDVKLDNNGGFVQAALNLSKQTVKDIEAFTGLMLQVYGNNEEYNIHLRTTDVWLPWQSYRATFVAPSTWKTLYIPFTEFTPYRIRKALNINKIKRIGIVAIGREFKADLCIGQVGLYK
jgi:hypothetical protein